MAFCLNTLSSMRRILLSIYSKLSFEILVYYKQFIFHKGQIDCILKSILSNGKINSRYDKGFWRANLHIIVLFVILYMHLKF